MEDLTGSCGPFSEVLQAYRGCGGRIMEVGNSDRHEIPIQHGLEFRVLGSRV